MRISIIGSFRKHFSEILILREQLLRHGHTVTSPIGNEILKPGVDFVRFDSDDAYRTDAHVQTIAMHRILSADCCYVCCVDQYVGRTTCYEIGRIIQARRPLYFSERPDDLPVDLHDDHIIPRQLLGATCSEPSFSPKQARFQGSPQYVEFELDILNGNFRDESQLR